MTLNW